MKPTKDDIWVGKPVCITLESNDWNPHCGSFVDNKAFLTSYRGEVLASSYRYNDKLKNNKSLSINSVLGEAETYNRSSKDGLKVMIGLVQAPVSNSISDHPKI